MQYRNEISKLTRDTQRGLPALPRSLASGLAWDKELALVVSTDCSRYYCTDEEWYEEDAGKPHASRVCTICRAGFPDLCLHLSALATDTLLN